MGGQKSYRPYVTKITHCSSLTILLNNGNCSNCTSKSGTICMPRNRLIANQCNIATTYLYNWFQSTNCWGEKNIFLQIHLQGITKYLKFTNGTEQLDALLSNQTTDHNNMCTTCGVPSYSLQQ